MAYINQTSEEEATGKVASMHKASRERTGSVANILKVMSCDGQSLLGSMQLYMSLMKLPNAVSSAQREMLGTVVSNANDCYY